MNSTAPTATSNTVSILVRSMARDTLYRCLATLALQQGSDIEIVVLNATGGAHPVLAERCGPHPLRLHNPGQALRRSEAANLALSLARGRWVIFVDDDDRIDPHHIERLRTALQADPSAAAAYAGIRLLGDSEPATRVLDEEFDLVRLHCENYLPIHAVLFSRQAAGLAPWFDESLDVYEDWDFWLRLAQSQRFVHVRGVSASYHLEGNSGLTHHPDAGITHAGRMAIFSKWAGRIQPAVLEQLATRAETARTNLATLEKERIKLDHRLAEQAQALQQIQAQNEDEGRRSDQTQGLLAQAQVLVHELQAQAQTAQMQQQELWRQLQAKQSELQSVQLEREAWHQRASQQQQALDAGLNEQGLLHQQLQQVQAGAAEHHARLELALGLENQRARRLEAEMQSAVLSYRLLEEGYGQVTQSISWRVTAPVRKLRSLFARQNGVSSARKLVRNVVRHLPVSGPQKQRLKMWMVARPWAARWLPWLAISSSPVVRSLSPHAADAAWPSAGAAGSSCPSKPLGPVNKEAIRADAEAQLTRFLQGHQRISFQRNPVPPQVSVVIVLYNQAGLSLLCLKSLMASTGVSFEVLIVDNASSDRMPQLLARVDDAMLLPQDHNLGFLRAVNLAAQQAQGEYLLLLNNDAMVEPETLCSAVRRLTQEPDVGAVGGPILLWDGRLQEAGSIVWRDGSCLGYGRGGNPAAPAYGFVRDVDYCSGALLMVRRSLFEQLGRFDEAFAPAYYEETDFCVRLWEHGERVVYDPAVRVKHFEFASDEGSGRAIELQTQHQTLFVARHAEFLAQRPAPAPNQVLQARQRLASGKKRILVIDDRVPLQWLGQGYPRAAQMLRVLAGAGHLVTHYPLQFPHEGLADIARALPERVEVMREYGLAGLSGFLAERQGFYDVVLISRPHNMEVLTAVTAAHPEWLGQARVVYDAEALFSLRDVAKAAVLGENLNAAEGQRLVDAEMALARRADAIITVSELEASHYRAAGYADVHVLGHAMHHLPTQADFASRSGFLFVGALPADDTPNADSLLWFVGAVWPLLQAQLGDSVRLHVVGACSSPAINALASRSIILHGTVTDLGAHFNSARVFVVPTRYAAGIAHKAHEAAAFGLPMVTTALIAEQLCWSDVVAVGADAAGFAQASAALYNEPDRWQSARDRALEAVLIDCAPVLFEAATLAAVEGRMPPARHALMSEDQ